MNSRFALPLLFASLVACGADDGASDEVSPDEKVTLRNELSAKWSGTWTGSFVDTSKEAAVPFELRVEAVEGAAQVSPQCGNVSLNGLGLRCVTVKELTLVATLKSAGKLDQSIPAFETEAVTAKAAIYGNVDQSELSVSAKNGFRFYVSANRGSWSNGSLGGTLTLNPRATN